MHHVIKGALAGGAIGAVAAAMQQRNQLIPYVPDETGTAAEDGPEVSAAGVNGSMGAAPPSGSSTLGPAVAKGAAQGAAVGAGVGLLARWRSNRRARALAAAQAGPLAHLGDGLGDQVEHLSARVGEWADAARPQLEAAAERAAETVADLATAARPRVETLVDRVGHVVDIALERAGDAAEVARERAAEAAEVARERAAEAAELARERGASR